MIWLEQHEEHHDMEVKTTQRVYLSGGMEYADGEGRAWRANLQRWLEENLSCEVFNPNRESDRFLAANYPMVNFRKLKREDMARFRAIVERLVTFDCAEIAVRSDFVICLWDEAAMRGAGTKGELTIAKYFGKPVYLVTSMPQEEIPGWVLGCITQMFASFEELKGFLTLPNSKK
jgi:hypothetical protein